MMFSPIQTGLPRDDESQASTHWSIPFMKSPTSKTGFERFMDFDRYFIYRRVTRGIDNKQKKKKELIIENDKHEELFVIHEEYNYCTQLWCRGNRHTVFHLEDLTTHTNIITIQCPFNCCASCCSPLPCSCSYKRATIVDSMTGKCLGMAEMEGRFHLQFQIFVSESFPDSPSPFTGRETQDKTSIQQEQQSDQQLHSPQFEQRRPSVEFSFSVNKNTAVQNYKISNDRGCFCMGFTCFEDRDFIVTNAGDEGGHEVAVITRPFIGLGVLSRNNSLVYTIRFSNLNHEIPPADKAVILGAAFVLETVLYNGHRFD